MNIVETFIFGYHTHEVKLHFVIFYSMVTEYPIMTISEHIIVLAAIDPNQDGHAQLDIADEAFEAESQRHGRIGGRHGLPRRGEGRH
jgi:hypothetical protein